MPLDKTEKTLIRTAIDALKLEKKKIAFDANFGRGMTQAPPEMVSRIARYDLIVQAIAYLEGMLKLK